MNIAHPNSMVKESAERLNGLSRASALKPVHYVMWEIGPGGAELSVNDYIHHFASRRQLNAYSLRPVGKEIYDPSKINIRQGSDNNLECFIKYFRYCREHKNDIFHLLNTGPIILFLTVLAGVKNPVFHIHGTRPFNSPLQKLVLLPLWILTHLFFHFTVVANSQHSAAVFRREVLKIPLKIIYNGIAAERFLEKRSLRTALHRIGYAGRLSAGKNVDLVIRLFEEVAGSRPSLELWIAGGGPLQKAMKEEAAKSPFADRIRLLGHVQDMPSFYASVDLLVFISEHESFGNVLVEALLTGLPILTSDIPAFNEIHGGEKDFTLGNPADYRQLKENFIGAIVNFPPLATKALNLSDKIKEAFNSQHHAKKIEKLYESLH